MVIEESSVVATCANSAKFWLNRGGFKTTVIGMKSWACSLHGGNKTGTLSQIFLNLTKNLFSIPLWS